MPLWSATCPAPPRRCRPCRTPARRTAPTPCRCAGHQLLRVHHDGREGRGQDQADRHGEHAGPEQVRVRQQQREGQHAEDRNPDHVLAAQPVAERAAEDAAGRHRGQEHEQVQLGGAHRQVELVDQVEGVVAGDARQVEVLGEDQRQQHARSPAPRAARGVCRLRTGGGCQALDAVCLVPVADVEQHARCPAAPPPRTTPRSSGRAAAR